MIRKIIGKILDKIRKKKKTEKNDSKKIPENTPEKTPEKVPEKTPEKVPEKVPEKIEEKIPEKEADEIAQKIVEKKPEKLPEKAQKDVPGKISKKPAKKFPKKLIKYALILFVIASGIMSVVRNYDRIQQLISEKKGEILQTEDGKAPAGIPFQPEAPALPIKVFKAKRTSFKDTLPVLGTMKGFREVNLSFETSGMLESFNFEEGDKVEEGDIVASLNQRDALLKLEYSKLEFEKKEKLFKLGAIIESEVEQARLEYESSKSDFEKTNLYAPRDGLLGMKYAEEGETVAQNVEIATFLDIKSVYAEFGIIEKDMPKVELGQKAEVFVDAYPGESYQGVVEQIFPVVEGKSRTQTLRVRLDNEEGNLKPGMFARGVIATYEKEDALIIPTTGVKTKEPGYFVYVVHILESEEAPGEELADEEAAEEGESGEGLAEKMGFGAEANEEEEEAAGPADEIGKFGEIEIREVEIEYMAPDYAEISKGLEEGEFIAVEIREELKDKAKIEITEVQEAPF